MDSLIFLRIAVLRQREHESFKIGQTKILIKFIRSDVARIPASTIDFCANKKQQDGNFSRETRHVSVSLLIRLVTLSGERTKMIHFNVSRPI